MELNIFFIITVLFTHFLVSFPFGYLILHKKLKSFPFIIKLPIFISLGIFFNSIILVLIGIVVVHYVVILSISISLYFVIFYKIKPKITFSFKISSLRKNYVNIISFIILGLVFTHFILLDEYFGWPPAGDASGHSQITSLLIHNGKISSTMEPLSSAPIQSPLGFHVIASNFSTLFDIFPGVSVLLLVTTIVLLIIWLSYSLVYIKTNSIPLSLIILCSTFFIHPVGNLETWLLGFFYNGPYPNLFGFLGLLLFLFLWLLFPDERRKGLEYKLAISSCIFGLLVVYPPFAIFPVLFIFLEFLYKKFYKNHHLKQTIYNMVFHKHKYKLVLGIVILIIFSFFASNSDKLLVQNLKEIKRFSEAYNFKIEEYITPEVYLLFGFSISLSIISILYNKNIRFNVFYLTFSGIIFLSTYETFFQYLWFLLPKRNLAILYVISWIAIILFVNEIIRWGITTRSFYSIRKYFSKNYIFHITTSSLALIIILTVFIGDIEAQINFESAKKFGWFPITTYSGGENYELLKWISQNVGSNELIMNDYTATSSFINSFSIKNLTAITWWNTEEQRERARLGNITWENPRFLGNYITLYNVKYVLVDDEWVHLNYKEIGGQDSFIPKKFSAEGYEKIFAGFPFLTQIKKMGSSSLYEVDQSLLNNSVPPSSYYDITRSTEWWEYGNQDTFSIESYKRDQTLIKITNGEGIAASIMHTYVGLLKGFHSSSIKNLDFAISSENPAKIEIFLLGPPGNYYRYEFYLEANNLNSISFQNFTIPVNTPSTVHEQPDLRFLQDIQINIISDTPENEVRIHKFVFS